MFKTAADERIEVAKEHVRQALLAINDIVVGEINGTEDFSEEMTQAIMRSHAALLEIRRDLK